MAGTQRNDQCPCGSGSKYKKCCLNKHSQPLKPAADNGTAPNGGDRYPLIDRSTTPDFDVHGYLHRETITTTFTYKDLPEGVTEQPRPEGSQGVYDVEFTLQPPSRIIMDSHNFECGAGLKGGSLIAIAKPVPRTGTDIDRMNIDVLANPIDPNQPPSHLKFLLLPNDEGHLSTVFVSINANSMAEAAREAWIGFAPVLSKIAFIHDVPLEVYRIRTEERATKSASCTFTHHMYRQVGFDHNTFGPFGSVSMQYHPMVYYREALGASSPFYQYLCYYKVIEMVIKMRRERVVAAKREGKDPDVTTERLIENEWLTKNVEKRLLSSAIGKKVTELKDKLFRPVRNRIAHELLEDEEPTDTKAEDLLNEEEVFKVLPLIKHVARLMIVTDMTPKVSQ